jgi:hypothetical protein
VRDLLLCEGFVVAERPRWSRSRNTADLYLQLGQWMLFIGRHDTRRGGYAIVTVVSGREGTTWSKALRRGYIVTPPPRSLIEQRRGHVASLLARLTALGSGRGARE